MKWLLAKIASLVSRVEVVGPSMEPTLVAGERLLVRRSNRVKPGDIIVFVDPTEPSRKLIKRISDTTHAGFVVTGDNSGASRDSGEFGPVTFDLVIGRAWYRYYPAKSRGKLGRKAQGLST
jgi:nickel-type superoxide dismutase maturation protease